MHDAKSPYLLALDNFFASFFLLCSWYKAERDRHTFVMMLFCFYVIIVVFVYMLVVDLPHAIHADTCEHEVFSRV